MAVDIRKLFNEDLPAQLAKHPKEAKEIGATFQINVTGDGGGKWHIDVSGTGPSATESEKPADCTLTVASEDFQKLYTDPQAGTQLFFSGKLKVAGNPMLAMKLQKLFKLGE